MALRARFTDQAAQVLEWAGRFVAARPVEHNLILTLLYARRARPAPGRYWVLQEAGDTVGVVFQSPEHFSATITPMAPPVVAAAVEAIVQRGVDLPGVMGQAGSAARFAGCWTEQRGAAAIPEVGSRLYQLQAPQLPAAPPGGFVQATSADRDLLVRFIQAFSEGAGEPATDAADFVDNTLVAGQLWGWRTNHLVSIAAHTEPIEGISRIRAVYTPPAERQHGYASACVGALSQHLSNQGLQCILYTDLANPTSNAIYRRLGYTCTAELLRYGFTNPSRLHAR